MQLLPKKLPWERAQDLWAAIINPVLSNPVLSSSMLLNVSLTSGNNVVNHKLGRKLQGWMISRIRNNYAEIYDTQDGNSTPALTLNLNSSVDVVVDIVVF